ncbi:MAG: TIGR03016 family PEP-CTERM system-associated outer membrane protein, partial [Hydrogenophaga sp.]
STGATLSSNGSLTQDARSEQVIEVSPGVRVVANGARIKGSLDYSLRAMHHFQGTSDDSLGHALNALGSVELWDGRAYVDASAVISDETITAFGPNGGSGISDNNRSETFSYRFSPYVKGRLVGAADYELR